MIIFNSKDIRYKKPFGAVACMQAAEFNIEAKREGHFAKEAYLVMALDGEEPIYVSFSSNTGNCFTFEWQAPFGGLFYYGFKVIYEDRFVEVSPNHQLTVYEKDQYPVPEWLSHGLMYQIFPDRFSRGEEFDEEKAEKLMTRGRYLHKAWGEMPHEGNIDFFGGTLRGIEEKLDYLSDLGVTIIYLNPIFEAFSNHRYDTADYMRIDPLLGTEEDFSNLCLSAAKKGIRIIIDGVFNHTGSDSIYFNKYKTYGDGGAYNDPESPYYEWYEFSDYPNAYESWWGIDTLPAIDEKNPSYSNFIYKDENSVIRKWLEVGASGIRLDVADELPDEFVDGIREAMKGTKANAALIGEVWEDASNKVSYGKRRRYLQGGQLDSVMNYPLKDAIIGFVSGNLNAEELLKSIEALRENYPRDIFHSLMNILGTHDTARIKTILGNNQKLFQAIMLQLFLPGIPCIYYGDENGMAGGKDPLNRGCFEPEKADKEVREFYEKLLIFRKKIKGIGETSKSGYASFKCVKISGGIFAFERESNEMRLFVAVNTNNADEIQLNDKPTDFISANGAKIDDKGLLYLPPLSCAACIF